MLPFAVWLAFYFLLCMIIMIFFSKMIKSEEERKILMIFFLIGLIARLCIGGALHIMAVLYGNGIDISGDGHAYAVNGRWISGIIDGSIRKMPILYNSMPAWEEISGILTPQGTWGVRLPSLQEYQTNLWAYLLGMFYYVFGFFPIIGIMINMLLGALLPINLYFITKRFLDKEIAYRIKITILTFFTFFPSLFLWSITNSRDTIIIYLLSIFILSFLRFGKNNFLFITVPLLSTVIICLFRRQMLYPMLFLTPSFIYLKWVCNKNSLTRVILSVLIGFFLLACLQFFHIFNLKLLLEKFFMDVIGFQKGTYTTGGTIYYILPGYYYSNIDNLHLSFFHYLILFFKGWFHLLVEPLPFRIKTPLSVVSYPQVILGFFLVLFSVKGMAVCIQRKKLPALIIIFYIVTIGTTVALYGGNVGTTFRLRDMILPFILIFSVIGIEKLIFNNVRKT